VSAGSRAAQRAAAAMLASRWQTSAQRRTATTRKPQTLGEMLASRGLDLNAVAHPDEAEQPNEHVHPAARLIRTFRDAELAARDFLRWLSYTDAQVTSEGADGGIDVVSAQIVAQVKAETVRTGRPAVQALFGAACGIGKHACFFSLAGYSGEAVAWANQARVQMPLFRFDLQGRPEPANRVAQEMLARAMDAQRPVTPSAADSWAEFASRCELLVGDGPPVAWVRPLTQHEAAAARQVAVSESNRVAQSLRREDGDEMLAMRDLAAQMDRIRLVEGVVSLRYTTHVGIAAEAIHADPLWHEVHNKLTRNHRRPVPRDELDRINSEYLQVLDSRIDSLNSVARLQLEGLNDESLRRAYIDAFIDKRVADVLVREMQYREILYGVRSCHAAGSVAPWDHSHCTHPQLYRDVDEVRALSEGTWSILRAAVKRATDPSFA
jgi:hypothetical protein